MGSGLSLRRLVRRLAARLGPVLQSDAAFVEAAYLEVLGRPADQDGINHYLGLLSEGLGRTAVILDLVRSDEFRQKLKPVHHALPSLIALRPDCYRQTIDRSNGQTITVFDAVDAADVDWLETAILANGYYEQPGVWTLGVDADKRLMAEMMASFLSAGDRASRSLELGCAAGSVLECLEDLGSLGEGVEISEMAIARASDKVRPRIHKGDLLGLQLTRPYDVTYGFDIFEHLNPNRLDAYIERLSSLTRDDGYLFVNVPAFGTDPIFGSVFPLYVEGWDRDADAGKRFTAFHVDERGYPLHGHLVWADARWWVRQFERHGFTRDVEIERALHRKYDDHLKKRSPARAAFFVFAKGSRAERRRGVLERVARPSDVLKG